MTKIGTSRLEEKKKVALPAVVGLVGFAVATIVFQLYNLHLCRIGIVIATGMVIGGFLQLLAGYLEFKVGNSFAFCAFSGYGSMWVALAIIFFFEAFTPIQIGVFDTGFFLMIWVLFTAILWWAAIRINSALALTFTLLFLGLIMADFASFLPMLSSVLLPISSYILIGSSLTALYIVASSIYEEVFGRVYLPLGPPWMR